MGSLLEPGHYIRYIQAGSCSDGREMQALTSPCTLTYGSEPTVSHGASSACMRPVRAHTSRATTAMRSTIRIATRTRSDHLRTEWELSMAITVPRGQTAG